jgi:hypothetical protein
MEDLGFAPAQDDLVRRLPECEPYSLHGEETAQVDSTRVRGLRLIQQPFRTVSHNLDQCCRVSSTYDDCDGSGKFLEARP